MTWGLWTPAAPSFPCWGAGVCSKRWSILGPLSANSGRACVGCHPHNGGLGPDALCILSPRGFSLLQACAVCSRVCEAQSVCFQFLTIVNVLYLEAGDEIVDLTCESLEPVVVDLTHNDSVVVSGGTVGPRPAQGPQVSR